MKRLLPITLVLLLAVSVAAPAYAGANLTKAQRQALKDWNNYNRQQAKIQRQLIKQQNKMLKNWNKTHPVRTVTR